MEQTELVGLSLDILWIGNEYYGERIYSFFQHFKTPRLEMLSHNYNSTFKKFKPYINVHLLVYYIEVHAKKFFSFLKKYFWAN